MTLQLWITLIGIAIGIVAQIVIAAYVYGKLTSTVADHGRRLSDLDTAAEGVARMSGTVDEHGRRHASHDTRFAELGGEQNRQWESIGRHGEKISAVEARVTSLERNR